MRLTFVALAALALAGCGSGPKAEPVTTVDALAPLVPKELALDSTPIPDSENGYLAMVAPAIPQSLRESGVAPFYMPKVAIIRGGVMFRAS